MIAGALRRGLLIPVSEVAERTGLAISVVEWVEERDVRSLSTWLLAAYLKGIGGRLEAVIPAPGGTERRVVL